MDGLSKAARALSVHHLPLAGYLSLIACCCSALLSRAPRPLLRRRSARVYASCALVSLGVTWTYMLLYFERSFLDAALRANVRPARYTTAHWLESTSLFVEAWGFVCATAHRWLVSGQLCAWTSGPFVVLLHSRSRRASLSPVVPLLIMALAQLVAVSFAQSLFFASLSASPSYLNSVSPRSSGQRAVPRTLLLSSLVALLCTRLTPPAIASGVIPFSLALGLMHLALFLPLHPESQRALALERTLARVRVPALSDRALFLLTGAISLEGRLATLTSIARSVLRERKRAAPVALSHLLTSWRKSSAAPSTTSAAYATLARGLLAATTRGAWQTLNAHPAQQSIGWDVILSSLTALVFCAHELVARVRAPKKAALPALALALLLTPLFGVAVTASALLWYIEVIDDERRQLAQRRAGQKRQ